MQGIGQCDSRVGVEALVVQIDATLLEEAPRLGLGFGQFAPRQQVNRIDAIDEKFTRPLER